VVPAAASSGKISVTVAGTTVKSRATFYVLPTITGFSPGSGRVGTLVTITGTGFTNATRVLFAGVAAVYKVVSPTQIQATVPSGTKSGKITVRTAGGSATSAVGFTLLH
jgi:large repetitive protein